MRLPALPRPLLALAALALAGGCGDTTAPPAVIPLVRAVWYMHEADSAAVPAKIHERTVGVALEETYVDSAVLSLTALNTYEQTWYLHVDVSGVLDRTEIVIDRGVITAQGQQYRLTSQMRPARDFTLGTVSPGVIETSEQLLFLETDPPQTVGRYRLTRP